MATHSSFLAPLEEEMATHSSFLAWAIPWMGLQELDTTK